MGKVLINWKALWINVKSDPIIKDIVDTINRNWTADILDNNELGSDSTNE